MQITRNAMENTIETIKFVMIISKQQLAKYQIGHWDIEPETELRKKKMTIKIE